MGSQHAMQMDTVPQTCLPDILDVVWNLDGIVCQIMSVDIYLLRKEQVLGIRVGRNQGRHLLRMLHDLG